MTNTAARFRAARERYGLTRAELADRIRLPERTIERLEQGRSDDPPAWHETVTLYLERFGPLPPTPPAPPAGPRSPRTAPPSRER